jgi:signal transduction histidine kinase
MKEAFSINELLLKIREQYLLQGGSQSYQIIGAEELQENALGDRTKIEQVLRNLIDNAFHHSNSEDPVEVIVTQSRDRFKIEVRDRGEGIEEDELTHVFERYYRGKRADGIKSKGTGLGLAIVKSILELHQMPYGVTSQLGKGTTFWFQLEKEKGSFS